MSGNPLKRLGTLGQSIWLDYIRRDLIAGGELRRLIEEDGLRGMTSNPSIFEKAITGSHDYDGDIRALALEGKGIQAIYEVLSVCDVQGAADEFRPLYDKTDGKDGYVSLEVNPHLAHDTKGTIDEARRLWATLNRPNVFIKVPATAEGLPAIQQLIGEGISVNVTLLFGLPRYRQVAEAYIAGIEARAAQGKAVNHVASVASFFVSRIDGLVDPLLEKLAVRGGESAELAKKVHGQVAISSAKVAYQIYKEIFGHDRFKRLAGNGARVQRLLWASTRSLPRSAVDPLWRSQRRTGQRPGSRGRTTHHRTVRSRAYPQYGGFTLIIIGFLLQWPTLLTVLMFPVLVWMYRKLAWREATRWRSLEMPMCGTRRRRRRSSCGSADGNGSSWTTRGPTLRWTGVLVLIGLPMCGPRERMF